MSNIVELAQLQVQWQHQYLYHQLQLTLVLEVPSVTGRYVPAAVNATTDAALAGTLLEY